MTDKAPLLGIAQMLLGRQLDRSGPRLTHGLAGTALCAMALAICAITAFVCLVTAAWLFAASKIGVIYAPLAVAGALLTLSLILMIVIRLRLRVHRVPAPPQADPAAQIEALLAVFQNNKRDALLAALIAGVQAGYSRD